jgi:large subunit ribosomal protein L24
MKKLKKKNSQSKIHVKVGELIKVISGKDKGKTGVVNKVLREKSQILVKGINIKVKHLKPSQPGQTGEIKQNDNVIFKQNKNIFLRNLNLRLKAFFKKKQVIKKANKK